MSDEPVSEPDGPKLKFLHDEATIKANSPYPHWDRRPTDDIVDSLNPGRRSPLTVKPDGTIVDGNTRVWILRQRGFDVDSLPRVFYDSLKLEDFNG